jgi:hypothetical protein
MRASCVRLCMFVGVQVVVCVYLCTYSLVLYVCTYTYVHVKVMFWQPSFNFHSDDIFSTHAPNSSLQHCYTTFVMWL